ncbi:hypothetical protein C882_2485 [Caenispirillum salinarum AK4]|uniref:Divergent polysaccharide deacetylase family protein n=1 Tax=Caenispirillum salinarum AK4 TaxID=1238182 RepID=K9HVZ5_9PROT|nr:divergent polysaccharide deacetylase family protein [Caenispirillum salinarum]EKV32406.1 hypothetical protein C882_2485 [Caenispirillum salinarum AK4]
MALNLKSLFSRKKKTDAEDGEEPFFTGATLGPGLDDGLAHDDAGAPDGDAGDGAADQPRDFADILEDEDWGDGLEDDDDVLGHGARKRKRLAMLAGVGVVAALVAGGAAWWMLTGDEAAEGPRMAEAGTPAPEPTAPIGSGSKVSLPMPAAPGLDDVRESGAQDGAQSADAGATTDTGAVLDPTAATDKSIARRPWLAEDGGSAPAREADEGAPQGQTAEAPAEGGDADAADATAETAAAGDQPAENQGEAASAAEDTAPAAEAPGETQTAAAPATAQPPAPAEIDEPRIPDTRDARPTPSYDELPAVPEDEMEPLRDAPVAALTRETPAGPMPIPAPDGRKAWSTYAKPFEAPPGTPRVAIVVTDLGMRPAATTAAIDKLPPGVTLAFSPYGFELPESMSQAREAGHEVMLTLPMEGRGFPANDPGPLGLNTLLPVNDNLIRLNTLLTKGIGYTGLIGRDGAALTANTEIMAPVLEAIGRAGLLYVQPASGVQLASASGPAGVAPPTARVDLKLDERLFRGAIDARLKALETIARERGSAVAVIEPTPLGYTAVREWLQTLPQKGLALAPVSAVVRP